MAMFISLVRVFISYGEGSHDNCLFKNVFIQNFHIIKERSKEKNIKTERKTKRKEKRKERLRNI